MKAARLEEYGHADAVKIIDIEKPALTEGQVLVQVYASSINPFDIKVREGILRKAVSPPFTLGVDMAGVVVERGEGAEGLDIGDKVYGQAGVMNRGSGAFAEYAAALASKIALIPANLSFIEAGAIPLTGVSSLQALKHHMNLQKGQRILIHGGAGGIGSVAIQIAKHFGAEVTSTATGNEIGYVENLGADRVIDYRAESFESLFSGYDAVFDTVGGEVFNRSLKVLKKGGIIVSMLGQPESGLPEKYGIAAISQQTKVNTASLDELRDLIESGVVSVQVDRVFPLERLKDAFIAKETGEIHGKIAIEVRQ